MANLLVDLLSQVSGQWSVDIEPGIQGSEDGAVRKTHCLIQALPGLFRPFDQFQCDRHIGLDLQQHSCGDWRHDRGTFDGPDPQSCFWDFRC